MSETQQHAIADRPDTVAAIYEDNTIADSYLAKRMRYSWQRVLHRKQVAALNRVIAAHRPAQVLEVAPGPARLSTELQGVQSGVMVENSEQMIAIATQRLKNHGLDKIWRVLSGDAFALTSIVPAESFDFAFTFRFIRHFRTDDRERLYASFRQSLKPGGLFMFDVVNATVRDRIDAKNPTPSKEEIQIYDVTYSPESFAAEMKQNGFELLSLTPVLRHFESQAGWSYRLEDRARWASSLAVNALELLPSQQPLEWVALCKKV